MKRCEIVSILTGKYKLKLLVGPMKGMVVIRDCKQVTRVLQEKPEESAAATSAAEAATASASGAEEAEWLGTENIFGDNDDVK